MNVSFSSPTESLKYHLDNTKPHNKLVIDSEITAWFIPCEPTPATWVAAIVIYHLPSASEAFVNQDGTLKADREPRYYSDAGRLGLEAVLADENIMSRIIEFYPQNTRCPSGSQELR